MHIFQRRHDSSLSPYGPCFETIRINTKTSRMATRSAAEWATKDLSRRQGRVHRSARVAADSCVHRSIDRQSTTVARRVDYAATGRSPPDIYPRLG